MTQHTKCTVCGKETDCTTITFGSNSANAKPVVVMDSMIAAFSQMCGLSICDECAREKGASPRKAWITLAIAAVVLIASVIGFSVMMGETSGRTLPPLCVVLLVLLVVAWLTQIIAGMVLVMKGGFGKGVIFLLVFAQFLPVWGPFLLLCTKRKIDRNARAINALLPIAGERFGSQTEREELLKRQVENGEVSDPELLKEHERNEAIKREQQEKNATTVRKGNIGSALCGLAITVLIMLQGCEAYGSRSGYMELFGSIELSQEMFTLLIIGMLVFDGVLLVNALRKQ